MTGDGTELRSTDARVGLEPVTGAASVLTVGEPPVSAARAAAARAWLAVAERVDDQGDRAAAARRGLDALGDHHDDGTGETDDDTDQRIAAADASDDPSVRAALLTGTLGARLTVYQWRHEDRGLRFDPPLDDPDGDAEP